MDNKRKIFSDLRLIESRLGVGRVDPQYLTVVDSLIVVIDDVFHVNAIDNISLLQNHIEQRYILIEVTNYQKFIYEVVGCEGKSMYKLKKLNTITDI